MEFKIQGESIIVIGEDGEDLLEIAEKLREAEQTPRTMIVLSATGMLRDVKLGYWDGEKYIPHEFSTPLELLGISGHISKDADPFYHFHLILGTPTGEAIGGHFIEARIHNTLELFLLASPIPIKRISRGKLKVISLK